MKIKNSTRLKGELNIPLIYFMVAGTGVFFVFILYRLKQIPHIPCVFKAISGYPCPTCGATRVLCCLFKLDFAAAFLWNPMIFLAGVFFLAWVLYGFYMLFSGQKIHIILNDNEKRLWSWGIVILFFLDWIYLAIKGV